MSFRFVHAADLHLDTPYDTIGHVASEDVREALRDASLRAFDNLIDLTIERDAAFLVLAGDIYDGAERGVRAQLRFRRGLERLHAAGIQTFVVHGNHDPLESGWSAIRDWPASVTIFGCSDVEAVPVTRDGVQLATVYGISYATRDVSENLSLRYHRREDPGIHLGLLHCNIGDDRDHAPYSPCSVDDLRRGGMDYWALGHIHKRHTVNAHAPWVVYPGNTQGRSSKPSERGAKGALVVTVDGTAIQEPEFVALDRVRFVTIEVDVTDLPDVAAVQSALLDQTADIQAAHRDRGILMRAVVTGRGAIHTELARPGVLADLRRDVQDAVAGTDPFLWCESIRDETRLAIDRDAMRQRDDFLAALLEVSAGFGGDPDGLRSFAGERFGELERGPLARYVADLDDDPLPALLRSAEDLVIDLLEGGDA